MLFSSTRMKIYCRVLYERYALLLAIMIAPSLVLVYVHVSSGDGEVKGESKKLTDTYHIEKESDLEIPDPIRNYVTSSPGDSFRDNMQGSAGNRPLKKILYWTNVWGTQRDIVLGQKAFLDTSCKVSNCFLTTNKSDASQAAAIIFHMMDVKKTIIYPTPRLSHQNWVFLSWVSPESLKNTLSPYRGMFNLTMTYRHDSDIYSPVGRVIHSPALVAKVEKRWSPVKIAFKRKKLVAWFASDCNVPSNRSLYVKELQKHIQVDIYGKCGTKRCSKLSAVECYRMLEESYKFYLSFENSLCKDYITEKVFNVLNYNVVPVVLGLGDYSRDLPPKSFINAMDFKSPKDLASFLTELENNETRYNDYLKWKSEYYIDTREGITKMWRDSGLCSLCEYVNKPIQHRVHDDIEKWWRTDGICDNDLLNRLSKNW